MFWLFYNFSETLLVLRRIQLDTIINVDTSLREVPIIPVRFEQNLKFLDRFLKNAQIPNFMKIPHVGAELFYPDGQTWQI